MIREPAIGIDKVSNDLELQSLSCRLYHSLKKEILRGILKPGDRLTENSLAKRFGVSRTPVREALHRFIQDGFIQVVPGVGYSVKPVTVRDIHEVFRLRVILEGEATELATPRIEDTQLNEIEELLSYLMTANNLEENDANRLEYVETNTNLHMIIAEASGNRRLLRIISSLLEEASRYAYLEYELVGNKGIEESMLVVETMRARDPIKAREYMEAHIRSTYHRALDAIIVDSDAQWIVSP